MWFVLIVAGVVSAVVVAVIWATWMRSNPPSENDPTRQHEATNPSQPHPDVHDHGTGHDRPPDGP